MTFLRPEGSARIYLGRLATIAALLAISVSLAACGGGASSSTGAPTASDTSPSTHEPSRAARRQARAERRTAGRAAPFVLPGSDNSVPTFGREAGAAERRVVEASLGRYLEAREKEDWVTACRGLAAPTRQGFQRLVHSAAQGCAPILAALSKEADLGDPLVAGLLSLRVEGQNAFALFYGPGHRRYFMPLLREAGAWKATQPAPIGYPLGGNG